MDPDRVLKPGSMRVQSSKACQTVQSSTIASEHAMCECSIPGCDVRFRLASALRGGQVGASGGIFGVIGALLAFVWCAPPLHCLSPVLHFAGVLRACSRHAGLLHCLSPRVIFCCCAENMLKARWPVDTGISDCFSGT